MTIRPLNPELAEKARKELNEDPSRVQEDIEKFREWVLIQPHIRARTDDQWLLLFLRGSKFNMERAKQKLDLYYTCRTTVPGFHRLHHTDPLFFEILDLGICIPLLKTWAPDAPVVTIVRAGVYEANKYNVMDILSVSNTIQKLQLLENDNAMVAGFQTILDMEGTTMAHFLQVTPMQMKQMAVMSQDASPARLKGFHYLNIPPTFETIFNMTKGLINEKIKKRIFVHNKNYEDLYKCIPKEILPVEYGGNTGTIPDILYHWKKKVVEYSTWLEEERQFGVDESKRPGKPKTTEEIFGIEGTFRQLEFD